MHSLQVVSLFAVAVTAQTGFNTLNWQGQFDAGSGVLLSIRPVSDPSFSFVPTDYFHLRNASGNHHTGDFNVRWRTVGQTAWQDISSASSKNVTPVSSKDSGVLLHSNYDRVWPDVAKFMTITRDWKEECGDLVLSVTIKNRDSCALELGGFGFPIEMNNIFTNRTAAETTAACVLVDPYIGLDAGYAQVTRLTGTGPNMIITPYGGNESRLEAWQQLTEDPSQPTTYQTTTFEGVQAWVTLSKGYAEKEWSNAQPWNPATSHILESGDSATFALRFGVVDQVYNIETAVADAGIPVAVGLPGYILPLDMTGKLFLRYSSDVDSITTDPPDALLFSEAAGASSLYQSFDVTAAASAFGRVRATVSYRDATKQAVHYFVTDTAVNSSAKLGHFLFDQQWYNDTSDVFNRAPSVISYDNSVGAPVLQEYRAWIAGISDDAGAGSFEAAAMKSSVHPIASEILQLEVMVNETVRGVLQDVNNTGYNTKYGVKRSVFFYEPEAVPDFQYDASFDWDQWSAWNRSEAYTVWRAYDYVHVSALYWGLYRASRANPGILNFQQPEWYLLQSYHTAMESQAMYSNGTNVTDYNNVGLMCETIWLETLKDLKAEGYTSEYNSLATVMKARQEYWASIAEPFGSEQPWDSTGQEGVYMWSQYFGDKATVNKTLNSIRGYMPTVAHWGYNGNARRYWDFTTGGKIAQIERMIHHYGSGLNALPVLGNYKYYHDPVSPLAFYDLRLGYGGTMGPLTNINAEGFGSQAFHSYPDLLQWEAYSGDYGLGYLGHIQGAVTFLVNHTDFGWVAMGGNVNVSGTMVKVAPKDSVRRRVYIASAGLFVEFDAGQITEFSFDTETHVISISLGCVDESNARNATMKFEDTLGTGVKLRTRGLGSRLDGYAVPVPGEVCFTV